MAVRHRVLLLEDDTNLGQIVQEHLQMQGFDVTLCVDGEDGMKAFASDRFDLCLVDIMMPRKDGFTFAREVRQHNQQTPLIFLTAKALKEDRLRRLHYQAVFRRGIAVAHTGRSAAYRGVLADGIHGNGLRHRRVPFRQ
jgi:CheY-like chemotaxis protein